MSRVAPSLAALCAAFAVACGGDAEDEPAPSATPSPDVEPTALAEVTPTPTATPEATPAATPETLAQDAGPVEALATETVEPGTPLLPELYVYDVQRSAEVLRESETYFQTWRELWGPGLYHVEEEVRFFDQVARAWQRVILPAPIRRLVTTSEGNLGAAFDGLNVYLIDLVNATMRNIPTRLAPLAFSPDGATLLLRTDEPGSESPYAVMPVEDPGATARLPLGTGDPGTQHSPRWIDPDRLLLVSEKTYLLQVYDVSAPQPQVLLEQPVGSDQVVASPDGSLIAVWEGAPAGSTGAVVVYELDPFGAIARVEGGSLGQYLEVSPHVWSSDSSKLLLLADACTANEHLIALNVAGGSAVDLGSGDGPAYRFALSPNGTWAAFTTHASNAYVVPADGGAAPVLVSENVNAPATPRWTGDAAIVAIPIYQGGYDICIG